MRKLKIKWLTSFMSIMILMTIPVYADANELKREYTEQIIQPCFTYISLFQNAMDISSDGKASISVYLTAQNVDSVRVDANLQQFKNGSWTTIKNWTNTSIGTNSGLNGTYYVAKGYQYRLVSNGYVYKQNIEIERTTYTSAIKQY